MSSPRGRGGRRAQTLSGERRSSRQSAQVSAVAASSQDAAAFAHSASVRLAEHWNAGTVDDRDRNRATLQDLVGSELATEQEVEVLAQNMTNISQSVGTARAEMSEMRKELDLRKQDTKESQEELSRQKQLIKQEMEELQQLKIEFMQSRKAESKQEQQNGTTMQQLKQDVDSMKDQFSKLAQKVSSDLTTPSKNENEKQIQQLKQQLDGMREQMQSRPLEEDVRRMKEDVRRMKDEIRKLARNGSELGSLKHDLQSQDRAVQLHGQTRLELAELKKQIYECGLLKQKRPEPEEGAMPPVGVLDLPEDIYSARLLLQLGFLRKRLDNHKAYQDESQGAALVSNHKRSQPMICVGRDESSDEETTYTQEFTSLREKFDNLGGIVLPEVDEGNSWAYFELTKGVFVMKITTMMVQLVILLVMVKSYMAAAHCTEGLLTPLDMKWWLLHISRSLAMLVAGAMTIKQILAIMNYAMLVVSVKGIDLEAAVTMCFRLMLNFLTIVVSLYMFFSSTDPAETWMNMTALGFIAGLSSDILGLARGGVFGAHISKGTTDLNFSVDIRHDYPWWFRPMRRFTLLICTPLIFFFAVFSFYKEDAICPNVVQQMARHPGMDRHRAGHAVHHKR